MRWGWIVLVALTVCTACGEEDTIELEKTAVPPPPVPPLPPSCTDVTDQSACEERSDCDWNVCRDCFGQPIFGICDGPGFVPACSPPRCPTPGSCESIHEQEVCDQASDCHSLFERDPSCTCDVPGCCMVFVECGAGPLATCSNSGQACGDEPDCELGFTPAYFGNCYDGCARESECGPS